ncbi:hypothetical protein [Sphingobacterium chungjuense]|uniref:hypothetical protein n=1 Tax=Sphingobacterium chungjuense TaxID=2675553 RepID=UPI00140AB097|nr:hypothetical protein [Sphingobacterium chungjuense]
MATKVETKNTGLKKEKKDETYQELTSVVKKNRENKQGKDAEAGVDANEEQINDMPNDPEARIPQKKE